MPQCRRSRKKKQQQQTENPQRHSYLWRVHERARTRAHAQRPAKIATACAESKWPGRPKPAAGGMRKQTAADHFRVDRSRRPCHRPAENETVNECVHCESAPALLVIPSAARDLTSHISRLFARSLAALGMTDMLLRACLRNYIPHFAFASAILDRRETRLAR